MSKKQTELGPILPEQSELSEERPIIEKELKHEDRSYTLRYGKRTGLLVDILGFNKKIISDGAYLDSTAVLINLIEWLQLDGLFNELFVGLSEFELKNNIQLFIKMVNKEISNVRSACYQISSEKPPLNYISNQLPLSVAIFVASNKVKLLKPVSKRIQSQLDEEADEQVYIYDSNAKCYVHVSNSIIEDHISMTTSHKMKNSLVEHFRSEMIRYCDVEYLSDQSRYIPLLNGILDKKTKEIVTRDNSQYNFLHCLPFAYDKTATSPVYKLSNGEDWEVMDWLKDLFKNPIEDDGDDENMFNLALQVLYSVICPQPTTNGIMLYDASGNNGKGTFLELCKQLNGVKACLAANLVQIEEEFKLSGLIGKTLVCSDENDVNGYLTTSTNFKTLVTRETLSINIKNKTPIQYQFEGLVIQCLNNYPKIGDKSGSLTRRLLFIPMMQQFEGVAIPEIKDEFLREPAVLTYLATYLLDNIQPFSKFNKPKRSEKVLEDYVDNNDPIVRFWKFVEEEQTVWSLLPQQYVYRLYKAWSKDNHGSPSNILSSSAFKIASEAVLEKNSKIFSWKLAKSPVPSTDKMAEKNPLLVEYGVTFLMPDIKGEQWLFQNWDNEGLRYLKKSYRGYVRK